MQLVLNEERIAGLVGQEVRLAVSSAVDAQLAAMAAPAQGGLSLEQWQALGKRLTGMEQQLQVVALRKRDAACSDAALWWLLLQRK